MFLELLLLLLVLAGMGWYVLHRQQAMSRELTAVRMAITELNEQGQLTFSGTTALVLWESTAHGGDANTGPWQTGFFLCRMPDAHTHYWLEIASTRQGQPARYKLEQLGELELACIRALHPDAVS